MEYRCLYCGEPVTNDRVACEDGKTIAQCKRCQDAANRRAMAWFGFSETDTSAGLDSAGR